MIAMQRNLYKFSAAKDAAMLREINTHLYNNKGNLKTFEEFRAALDSLNIKYNKNWLEAEYRTARQSSYMAQKWNDIQANKALFPNLKYKTQEDERVRKEHEALNNIIAPIDHPFWDKYFPPNGWRCRCDAVQTAEEPSSHIPDTLPGIKPEFHVNVGKTGQVFNENTETGHRFFALAKDDARWPKRFELSKLEAAFNTVNTPKGNKVKVSIYADEKDLGTNVASAIKATDNLGLKYEVRPNLNNGWKNPEYKINGLIADRYEGSFENGIDYKRKQIKEFIKQHNKQFPEKKLSENYAIHFDLTGLKITADVAKRINGELKQGNHLQFIVFEFDGKFAVIKRTDSFKTIEQIINTLRSKKG